MTAPVHVVEGSQTSAVDHAICDVVRRHVPQTRHTLIEGAGHMMPLTHPDPLACALLTEIERFATRCFDRDPENTLAPGVDKFERTQT